MRSPRRRPRRSRPVRCSSPQRGGRAPSRRESWSRSALAEHLRSEAVALTGPARPARCSPPNRSTRRRSLRRGLRAGRRPGRPALTAGDPARPLPRRRARPRARLLPRGDRLRRRPARARGPRQSAPPAAHSSGASCTSVSGALGRPAARAGGSRAGGRAGSRQRPRHRRRTAVELLEADAATVRLLEGDEIVPRAAAGEQELGALPERTLSTAWLVGDIVR